MIVVYRIGHRFERDKRVTTHVALVARAFGADKIFIDNRDEKLEKTIRSVCERFGGEFQIETGVKRSILLKQWQGTIVHLTMYGAELEESIEKINTKGDLLIIVGAEKVPSQVYQEADFNISVGNQPHSEIAALALFLDRYTKGGWQKKCFHGKIEIIPSARRKRVVSHVKKEA